MAENNKPLNAEENKKVVECGKAVKSLQVNETLTKVIDDKYHDIDIFEKLNLIKKYNSKIKYDDDGNPINIKEILEEIEGDKK